MGFGSQRLAGAQLHFIKGEYRGTQGLAKQRASRLGGLKSARANGAHARGVESNLLSVALRADTLRPGNSGVSISAVSRSNCLRDRVERQSCSDVAFAVDCCCDGIFQLLNYCILHFGCRISFFRHGEKGLLKIVFRFAMR